MFLSPQDIKIGKRFRKDVDTGINELCRSIEELGQLQPVIVDTNRVLLVGARRHRACELLERDVWVEEVDGLTNLVEKLKAEQHENTCRMPFTPSEATAIGKAIFEAEKPKAEERQKAGKLNVNTSAGLGNLPKGSPVRAADVAALAAGMSRSTFEHAVLVVDEAAKPDALPEVIEAARKMDETGKVDPAYKAVKAAMKRAKPKREPESQPEPAKQRDAANVVSILQASIREIVAKTIAAVDTDSASRKLIADDLRRLADEIENGN